MNLPPFGKQFQPVPRSGVRVAIGPGAWDFAKKHYHPCMVSPTAVADEKSFRRDDFSWPVDDRPALVFECGPSDDRALQGLAGALLMAGSPYVVAVREAQLNTDYPCAFFFPEVLNVAA